MAGTHKSAHKNEDCLDCHGGPKTADRMVFREQVMYQMVFHVGSASKEQLASVSNATCESCHHQINNGTTSTSNGLKIKHSSCDKGQSCTSCHSTVAHGVATMWPRQYDMNQCLECHAKAGVPSAQNDCNLCHDGSYDAPSPTAGTSFKNTHGKNWRQTHGMGDLQTCAACHDQNFCTPCHGEGVPHDDRFISTHGQIARTDSKHCYECHTDKAFCDDCHQMQMPHPSTFLKQHSSIVQKDGDTKCKNCHEQSDCDNCHAAHIHPGGAIQ